jgi:hypothetical protein
VVEEAGSATPAAGDDRRENATPTSFSRTESSQLASRAKSLAAAVLGSRAGFPAASSGGGEVRGGVEGRS